MNDVTLGDLLSHFKLLNVIIANNCPTQSSEDHVFQMHDIDLHCNKVRIIAKLVRPSASPFEYEIIDYLFENAGFDNTWLNRITEDHGIKWNK